MKSRWPVCNFLQIVLLYWKITHTHTHIHIHNSSQHFPAQFVFVYIPFHCEVCRDSVTGTERRVLSSWALSLLTTRLSIMYFYQFMYFYCYFYVFLLYVYVAGTLRLPWLRFFRAFTSVVRQMPGFNWQRWATARTLPNIFVLFYILFVLCRYVYCLFVNVYCTTATGWQPNCSFNKYILFRRFEWKLEI
jgi:hypothetical protein